MLAVKHQGHAEGEQEVSQYKLLACPVLGPGACCVPARRVFYQVPSSTGLRALMLSQASEALEFSGMSRVAGVSCFEPRLASFVGSAMKTPMDIGQVQRSVSALPNWLVV